jgi:uncharacterized Ntn-hydrolase superfamily protein
MTVMKLTLQYFSNSTFSIVARCAETSALGVCVSSASLSVGSAVPHVEPGVGALAVQGYTSFFHGVNGLRLLQMGFSPQDALARLLENDPNREMRQISIIDIYGRKAAFTGRKNLDWKGHLIRKECVVAGNALLSSEVLEAMAEAFTLSEGEWLAERLMKALEAGQNAGGDRRGACSAALIVAEIKPIHESRPIINLRVDMHKEPVKELRRIFEAYKVWLQAIR